MKRRAGEAYDSTEKGKDVSLNDPVHSIELVILERSSGDQSRLGKSRRCTPGRGGLFLLVRLRFRRRFRLPLTSRLYRVVVFGLNFFLGFLDVLTSGFSHFLFLFRDEKLRGLA